MTKKYFFYLLLMLSFQYYLTYGSSKLITLKETILEENDSIHWTSIQNISINPSQNLFSISSPIQYNHIVLYDLASGKIRKVISAARELTDSISRVISPFRANLKVLPYEFIPKNPKLYTIDNAFRAANFLNDSILEIAASLYYICIPKDESYDSYTRTVGIHHPTILSYNVLTDRMSMTVLNYVKTGDSIISYANSVNFAYDLLNKKRYVMVNDRSKLNLAVGLYDDYGNFLSRVHNYPPEIAKSKVMSSFNLEPILRLNNKSEIIVGYAQIPRIYIPSSNSYFELVNLNIDTYSIIDKLNQDKSYYQEIKDSLIQVLQFKLKDIYVDNNNQIVVYSIIYTKPFKEYAYIPHIQVYTQKGKLEKETTLDKINKNGQLLNVYYNKNNNHFYLFRKGDEHWTVEECTWDTD